MFLSCNNTNVLIDPDQYLLRYKSFPINEYGNAPTKYVAKQMTGRMIDVNKDGDTDLWEYLERSTPQNLVQWIRGIVPSSIYDTKLIKITKGVDRFKIAKQQDIVDILLDIKNNKTTIKDPDSLLELLTLASAKAMSNKEYEKAYRLYAEIAGISITKSRQFILAQQMMLLAKFKYSNDTDFLSYAEQFYKNVGEVPATDNYIKELEKNEKIQIFFRIYYAKAKVAETGKKLIRAYKLFQLAYKENDTHEDCLVSLVHLSSNFNNYEYVHKYADRLLELYPNSFVGWALKGAAYIDVGELDQAKVCFEKQIATHPQDQYTYVMLGKIAQFGYEPDQAIKYYQKALEINPDNLEAKERLQQIYRIAE